MIDLFLSYSVTNERYDALNKVDMVFGLCRQNISKPQSDGKSEWSSDSDEQDLIIKHSWTETWENSIGEFVDSKLFRFGWSKNLSILSTQEHTEIFLQVVNHDQLCGARIQFDSQDR